MRLGIVSFHAAYNYGAALQCRCLKEVLGALGHEVHVLDYRPDYLTEPYRILKPYYLKKPLVALSLPWRFPGAWQRNNAFRAFEKTLSPVPMDTPVDAVFFGSDQIWNSRICRGLDPVFFGSAPQFIGTRNIAYAASDGNVPLQGVQEQVFRQYLKHFYRIGVREQSLQDRLQGYGIRSSLTLDPVLLAGRAVLDKLADYRRIGESYLVTYEAVDNPCVQQIAASLSSGRRVIPIAREPYSRGRNGYGPQDFVSLLRDADAVVTTSFHAVALSLLFHKEFYYAETGTPADDRIRNLLSLTGLQERMVAPGAPLPASRISFSGADEALGALRAQSMDFIKEALQ